MGAARRFKGNLGQSERRFDPYEQLNAHPAASAEDDGRRINRQPGPKRTPPAAKLWRHLAPSAG